MKTFLNTLFALSFLLLISCKEKSSDPNDHLSQQEKAAIIKSIVRYAAKGPENVPAEDRFNKKYDAHYQDKANQMRLERYYPKGDDFYFLITQPAASLVEKRHATGGRFKLSDKGELIEYEEIFRTWKMVPDTLEVRSYEVFNNMIEGKSLEQYYTKNSKGIEFIEFPDDNTFYNVAVRAWEVKSNQ